MKRAKGRPQRPQRKDDVDVSLNDERYARCDHLNSSRADRRFIRKHRASLTRKARDLVR